MVRAIDCVPEDGAAAGNRALIDHSYHFHNLSRFLSHTQKKSTQFQASN